MTEAQVEVDLETAEKEHRALYEEARAGAQEAQARVFRIEGVLRFLASVKAEAKVATVIPRPPETE